MAENTKIEWAHHTANLWHGCTEVHAGCDNCYARILTQRWKRDLWGNDKPRMAIKSVWNDLTRFQKMAAEAGQKHRVFVNSMSDFFEKPMPLVDSKGIAMEIDDGNVAITTGFLRNKLIQQISAGDYPNLIFLLLTKRPSNINKYIPEAWKLNPPENVMFGTSPVDQKTAETLIPQLLQVKGQRFLSVEPQLGPIDLMNLEHRIAEEDATLKPLFGNTQIVDALKGELIHGNIGYNCQKIHWVIQGGESGHHKRPFSLEWAYDIRRQCAIAGVPYFFKQIDKIQQIPENLMIKEFPANHGQAQ